MNGKKVIWKMYKDCFGEDTDPQSRLCDFLKERSLIDSSESEFKRDFHLRCMDTVGLFRGKVVFGGLVVIDFNSISWSHETQQMTGIYPHDCRGSDCHQSTFSDMKCDPDP